MKPKENQCPKCESYDIVLTDKVSNEYERYDVVRCNECGNVFVIDSFIEEKEVTEK